jgi:hypothetical protein
MILYYILKIYQSSANWMKENYLSVVGILIGQFLYNLI